MPELPEVETVARQLKTKISGHKILDIDSNWPRLIKDINLTTLKKEVIGSIIETVERRGKYIIIKLSSKKYLIIHMKMTGNLLVSNCLKIKNKNSAKKEGRGCKEAFLNLINEKHIHLYLSLDKRKTLLLHDVRKFASLRLMNNEEKISFFSKLGPDAINKDFTLKYLSKKLKKSRKNIKEFLLDQKIIAGIGNIYASEILFSSKINPLRIANRITTKEINKLYVNINKILNKSILLGGTSFSDFKNIEGKEGNYYKKLKVYKREENKCFFCKNSIKKISINNRSTFYCPKCQKRK